MSRDDLLDVALVAAGLGLHVAGLALLDRLQPGVGLIGLLLVALPAVFALAAVVGLVRGDRRPVQVAATYAWLVVLFTLPAFGMGLAFAPGAIVLSVAALRRRSLSSAPPAAD